jgi:hypothetical protein
VHGAIICSSVNDLLYGGNNNYGYIAPTSNRSKHDELKVGSYRETELWSLSGG